MKRSFLTFANDNMNTQRRSVLRTAAAASALALCALSGTVVAQDAEAMRRVPGVFNVPCCKCDAGTTEIDLSTGVAQWQSPSGAVSVLAVTPGWKNPTAPAKWVSTGSSAPGSYTYNLKFNVPKNCSSTPRVSFSGLAFGDNNITVRLDDKQLGTTGVSSGGQANYGFRDPYGVTVAGGFGAGQHTLSVVVRNDGGPTGFLFQGKLKIECPKAGLYTNGDRPVY